MTGEAGGAITLLTGAITLRLALTGDYKRYVKPGMGPLLLVAGAVLVVLGAVIVVGALRRRATAGHGAATEHDHDSGHEHDHAPAGVGWLVLAPVVAVLLIAPPALGAFAVGRASRVDVTTGALFDPLPTSSSPRRMPVVEFVQRAADRDGASLASVPVELTGFVAGDDAEGFRLARYGIACCAGDAVVAVVAVRGGGVSPARDQWVRVTGTYEPGGQDEPRLRASAVEPIPPPNDPYE